MAKYNFYSGQLGFASDNSAVKINATLPSFKSFQQITPSHPTHTQHL